MGDAKRPCPACGEPVYPTDDVCMSCGAQLKQVTGPPPPTAPPSPVSGPPQYRPSLAPPPPPSLSPRARDRGPVGNWWDGQAAAYADWLLWVHLLFCQCAGLIVGLLFLIFCQTSEGKHKGLQLLLFSLIGVAIAVVYFVVRVMIAAHGGAVPHP